MNGLLLLPLLLISVLNMVQPGDAIKCYVCRNKMVMKNNNTVCVPGILPKSDSASFAKRQQQLYDIVECPPKHACGQTVTTVQYFEDVKTGNQKAVRLLDYRYCTPSAGGVGCRRYQGGNSRSSECVCNSNECNSSSRQAVTTGLLGLLLAVAFLL